MVSEMTDEERELREAEALRRYLEGDSPPDDVDDADAIGLLQHVGGAQAPDPWARIASESHRRTRRAGRWAAASFAIAASVAALMWWVPDTALRVGPSATELEAATMAIDPAYGSYAKRLDALNVVAARARAQLLDEVSR
ncbi:MAG: ferric-dicitrate binding protein FerR (iron transport regulator) [Myxococcota bacterium]|jgi:ferric-dicitrate binding protein FerR (iron transport regulator)